MKAKLLASASSEIKIRELIARYWYTKIENISLEPQHETKNTFEVWQNGKLMIGVHVKCAKNRFRFERFDFSI